MERLTQIGRVKPASAAEIGWSRLGVGFEKLDRKAFDPAAAYDQVAQLGVHYVRIQSGWQRTERAEGVYDFAWLDDIVDNIIARGQEPWIDLCYGNDLYNELARRYYGAVGCAPISSEQEKRAWESYVCALVARYRGRVQWFEIWNEPDGLFCWKHGVSAAEYGDFAVETANAIHRANPQAKVIGGVLTHIDLPYFKTMLDRGVADAVDALSFHRYNADEMNALAEIRALRALINRYNPRVQIIQGESGTQSDSRGCGALRGGAWTPEKQAKYTLRHRLLDLASEVAFTSHFSALDMIEALNGTVGDKQSYLDYGYFGVLNADFDENGFATGDYSPKPAYYALQNLASVFAEDFKAADLPIMFQPNKSPRIFDSDFKGKSLMWAGFKRDNGAAAFAYWNSADLMTTDFESTVTLDLCSMKGDVRLIDLMDGTVYALPESIVEKVGQTTIRLKNIPIKDYPLLLTIGDFAQ